MRHEEFAEWAATSERYRSENPGEFERIVQKRLSDSPSVASYYGQALAGWRFDDSADVGRTGAPTLVIHGAETAATPSWATSIAGATGASSNSCRRP